MGTKGIAIVDMDVDKLIVSIRREMKDWKP